MASPTKAPPEWYTFSHHDRYRKLNIVRRKWCRRPFRETSDQPGRTVFLDGAWINDVPCFYLSLGEAVNGPNGYFGGCSDALSDCLCGGFGVLPPLTIRLSHFDEVRKALDGRAWSRFLAEHFQRAIARGDTTEMLVDMGYLGDGSPSEIVRWTAKYEAAFAGDSFDSDEFGSYFDLIVRVLAAGGAEIVPETDEVI